MKYNNNEYQMIRNFHKYFTLLLVGLALTGGLQMLTAATLQFVPQAGYSQLTGSGGDDWKPGFNLGLDMFNLSGKQYGNIRLVHGLHVSFNRWQVDSDNLLELNGHEMRVEREKGVKDTWDITGLARYPIPLFESRAFRHYFDFGLGVHYICGSDMEVKGFYTYGDTAINREISRDATSDISPSITLGYTAMLNRQIQPSIRYQQFFESGQSNSGALLISLGMMAR